MADLLDRLRSAVRDRYYIERELGAGGMAIVYLAEDRKHGRKVAVKVLRPELAVTLGPERFVREIEIAAKLTHPHILPLYDSGEADGFLYYVMPYVEGESLRDRLNRQSRLPVQEAIRLTDQVASALAHAHERSVVHRDIKPENILLAGDQAIVADFGIARAVEAAGGERLTGTGLAIGTPAYMSPEQAFGSHAVDGRTDVCALGCVVYEMVCGRAPFEGPTPQALLARHAADSVPRLRARDPDIPLFVERAVERALAKDPGDRFPTAGAFAEALTSGTVLARVGRPRRPRRAVTAAVALVVVAAAGWWLSTMAGAPVIRRLAVLPLENLTNDPEQEYLIQGVHTGLIDELAIAGAAVIARRSVMQYRSAEKPVRDIARELGVDALIEGSVQRVGDSVRIRAQLIDGRTEEPLWTQTYHGELRNTVGLQRQAVRAIVDQIRLTVTPQAAARLAGGRPVNPEAYEAYLKGRFHWYRFTPQDVETALQYFELALEKDPDYALAYAGIGDVWGVRLTMGLPSEAGPRARAAVLKAIELDSTLAEAHDILARVKTWVEWDWAGAETEFRRAIELNPGYPDARVLYAFFLSAMKRPEEAMSEIQRALALDPFNSFFQLFYGWNLMYAGRHDDAIVQFRNAIRTSPNASAHLGLWQGFHQKRMYEEALVEAKKSFAAQGRGEVEEALTRGYAEAGYERAMSLAAETLSARSPMTYVPSFEIAQLYDYAGRSDGALEWLEKAFEERSPGMVILAVHPFSDAVRNDSRFQELLRRMNLPS